MTEIETTLRQMIAQIVDERIGSAAARGDAMARMYGEYVNLGTAAKIMGVSRPTVDKLRQEGALELRQEGALEFVPRVGVPVRSIAALPETVRAMAPAPSPGVRRTAQRVADFVRIEP